jgi:hypothetical protein
MGYTRDEAPDLWKDLDAAIAAGWAPGLGDDDRLCARDSRLCVVLRAQIKNPQNNEFVETLVHLADAFRDLLFGIVHDVKMERVFGNREWRQEVMGEPFSVLNHVSVRSLAAGPGESGKRVATRGLEKFGNADLVALSVPADLEKEVAFMLRDFAEHITQGDLIGADEAIDYDIGRIRLVSIPPLTEGGNEACALVDDVEGDDRTSPDPKKGAPRIYASLRAKRESIEGKRAGGGMGAQ